MPLSSRLVLSVKIYTIEDDSVWQKLKSKPVKIIRLSLNGKEVLTQEIEPKYANAIIQVITCIDALDIPKPQ